MPRPRVITGIDIGTSFVKALVVQKKPGSREAEVISQIKEPSFGVRKGVVVDVQKTAGCIERIIRRIEEECGIKINSVYANVGGSHVSCASSRGLVSVSRADKMISNEDIERVVQAAQTFSLPPNREILEAFPREFIVDGEKGIKEAIGIRGVRLESDVLVVCAFSPYAQNTNQAILSSGLRINDTILSPLASSLAALTPREKELGVAMLDIGAGTTDVAVFEEGNLLHLAILPIGSSNITNDIAIGLKTDIDTAEKIKLEYASCGPSSGKRKEKFKAGEEGSGQELIFSQKILKDVVEARISEIFDLANKELKKIGRVGLLPAGVVLTGGGAKMRKLDEFAKKEMKLPVRIGQPQGFSFQQNDPAYSVACGLVAQELNDENIGGIYNPDDGFIQRAKRFFRVFIP